MAQQLAMSRSAEREANNDTRVNLNGITISVYCYDNIVDILGHGGWGGMILDGPF